LPRASALPSAFPDHVAARRNGESGDANESAYALGGRGERGGSFLLAPPRSAMAFGADQPPEECGDEDDRDRRRDEVGDEGDVGDV
jgi:hypothetical protein